MRMTGESPDMFDAVATRSGMFGRLEPIGKHQRLSVRLGGGGVVLVN